MSKNQVFIEGNLGHDVTLEDVRHTGQGVPVVNFSVYTNESIRGTDGQRTQRSERHRITMFGNRAENEKILARMKKGALVGIDGYLRTNTWEDDDGVVRQSTEIRVDGAYDAFRILRDAKPKTDTPTDEAGEGQQQEDYPF